jgi:hypothetical protein
MLVMAVVKPIAALDLRDNGIRTSAFVQDVQQSGKNTDYEVSFPLQDGTAFTEWTGNLDSGTQVGDTIQIAYLAGSPSTLEDSKTSANWDAGGPRRSSSGPWAFSSSCSAGPCGGEARNPSRGHCGRGTAADRRLKPPPSTLVRAAPAAQWGYPPSSCCV